MVSKRHASRVANFFVSGVSVKIWSILILFPTKIEPNVQSLRNKDAIKKKLWSLLSQPLSGLQILITFGDIITRREWPTSVTGSIARITQLGLQLQIRFRRNRDQSENFGIIRFILLENMGFGYFSNLHRRSSWWLVMFPKSIMHHLKPMVRFFSLAQ